MSNYQIQNEAERSGWVIEHKLRMDSGGYYRGEFVTYRKGQQSIRVQTGPQGGVVWCARYNDGDIRPTAEQTARQSGKWATVVWWMSQHT